MIKQTSLIHNLTSLKNFLSYWDTLLRLFGLIILYGCFVNIRKTCPCNEYPLKPHFYIVKLGYAGVYLFFLFLLQNIDCGYLLEPARRGGSNVYPQSMFWAKIRKISKFLSENFHFCKQNIFYILHGRVFVMKCSFIPGSSDSDLSSYFNSNPIEESDDHTQSQTKRNKKKTITVYKKQEHCPGTWGFCFHKIKIFQK